MVRPRHVIDVVRKRPFLLLLLLFFFYNTIIKIIKLITDGKKKEEKHDLHRHYIHILYMYIKTHVLRVSLFVCRTRITIQLMMKTTTTTMTIIVLLMTLSPGTGAGERWAWRGRYSWAGWKCLRSLPDTWADTDGVACSGDTLSTRKEWRSRYIRTRRCTFPSTPVVITGSAWR